MWELVWRGFRRFAGFAAVVLPMLLGSGGLGPFGSFFL